MSRTISRSERMDDSIRFRCTQADRAAIKSASQEAGLDVSTYIRQILIREKIISPQGESNSLINF